MPGHTVVDVSIDRMSWCVSKTWMKVDPCVFPKKGPSDAQVRLNKNYGCRERGKSRQKERVYYFGRVFSEVVKLRIVKVSQNGKYWVIYSLEASTQGQTSNFSIYESNCHYTLQHHFSLLVANFDLMLTWSAPCVTFLLYGSLNISIKIDRGNQRDGGLRKEPCNMQKIH